MGYYSLTQAQADIATLRGELAHLQAYAELLTLVVDTSLTAPDGSTWTTSGLSRDSWHAASLVNGWVNAGGGLYVAQYKLMPFEAVWLIGVISPAAMTNTQFTTLPSGYRPQVGGDFPIGEHSSTPLGTQGAYLRVSSTGACSIQNSTTGSGAIVINSLIPLDNTT